MKVYHVEKGVVGRVIEARHGKDGYARSVKVCPISMILTRPVTRLFLLKGKKDTQYFGLNHEINLMSNSLV